MRITPAAELEARCGKLQALMAAQGLDAVIVAQNADLFYLTGTTQSGNLYLPVEGRPLYLVRRDIGRARRESELSEVIPFGSMRDIPRILAEYGLPLPKAIGMELDVLPVSLFERYRKVFPETRIGDATPLIRTVRMCKSPYEVAIARDAARQVDAVYRRVRAVLREGMSDLELAAELEYVARREGHPGMTRMRGFNSEFAIGHTFSGADSAVPAYSDTPLGGAGLSPSFGQGAGSRIVGRHEPVIFDFTGSVDGYLVDQTRMFAIGSVSDRLRKGFDDMCAIQERMKEVAVPGASWGAVYDSCRGLAASMGYADSFMGAAGAQVSFIGHGVGIELDEYPFIARGFSDMHLQPGMVFAFEPKLVFPGEGAVGIENTFYIEEDGALQQLTFSDESFVIL